MNNSAWRFVTLDWVFLFFGVFALCSQADAQNCRPGVPCVLTLESNVRYEGVYLPTAGFSQEVSPNPTAFRIDDGLRRVYVSSSQIVAENVSDRKETPIRIFQQTADVRPKPSPGILVNTSQFDEFGHRILRAVPGPGEPAYDYVQGVTTISPRYVEVAALQGGPKAPKRSWKMSVGLGLVPPNVVRSLLQNQISDRENPVEHFGIVDFYLEAQQFQNAEAELKLIQQKFPGSADRVEDIRVKVRQSHARQILEEVKRRQRNGQYELAGEIAERMKQDTDGVADQTLKELETIIKEIDGRQLEIENSLAKVTEHVDRFNADPNLTAPQKAMLKRFIDELKVELSPENVRRLSAFNSNADDPAQEEQQKVATAISGWLLGSNNATANFGEAESMFEVRDLIYRYLRSANPQDRGLIVDALKKFEAGTPEFVARMLAQMKPLDHDQAIDGYTGKEPIRFSVTVPGTKARPQDLEFPCSVHLPNEYDPYKKYPLLITLCDRNGSKRQEIADRQLSLFGGRWLDGAERRVRRAVQDGYIVMSVNWMLPGQNNTNYTAREHATILKAMRKSFRMFSVDTDRVFLHGFGIAANMVYDIGLSHPQHFAGIIPVGGIIEKYANVYARNRGVPLAVRGVAGLGDFVSLSGCSAVWDLWLGGKDYVDFTAVSYKGRLNDRFVDDHASMFNWMLFQRRKLPTTNGFKFDVKSLRPFDNYYWFLTVNGFPHENVTWPQLWKDSGHNALKISCEMKPQSVAPNRFIVGPSRAGDSMTIWLSDDFFDFENPIRISGRGKMFKGTVKPSVHVMLEHVRKQADPLHPAWARLDSIKGKWEVAP